MNRRMKQFLMVLLVATACATSDAQTKARGLVEQDGVPQCSEHKGIDFQIATDKLVYAPKSILHVKFLATGGGGGRGEESWRGWWGLGVLCVGGGLGCCGGGVGGCWV